MNKICSPKKTHPLSACNIFRQPDGTLFKHSKLHQEGNDQRHWERKIFQPFQDRFFIISFTKYGGDKSVSKVFGSKRREAFFSSVDSTVTYALLINLTETGWRWRKFSRPMFMHAYFSYINRGKDTGPAK